MLKYIHKHEEVTELGIQGIERREYNLKTLTGGHLGHSVGYSLFLQLRS